MFLEIKRISLSCCPLWKMTGEWRLLLINLTIIEPRVWSQHTALICNQFVFRGGYLIFGKLTKHTEIYVIRNTWYVDLENLPGFWLQTKEWKSLGTANLGNIIYTNYQIMGTYKTVTLSLHFKLPIYDYEFICKAESK